MTAAAAPGTSHGKALSPLTIATGFLPWIAFAFIAQRLAADGVAWSALIAVAITVITLVWGGVRHHPMQLNVFSLVLFTVMAVTGFVGGQAVDQWLYEWGRPLVGVVLGLMVLVTAGSRPFTAGYAKMSAPREVWDSPVFRRINRVLSATWGVALIVIGAASLVVTALDAQPGDTGSPYLLDLILNWVVPIAVLVWTIRFTNTYPDRVTAGTPQPAGQ